MKEHDRFDLEQKIMNCWQVCEDLELLAQRCRDPLTARLLEGIKSLYQLKFEDCFEVFEELCAKKKIQ